MNEKSYTIKQIANSYGRSYATTWRHIHKMIEQNKFVKKSLGVQFNIDEVKILETLLGFTFSPEMKHYKKRVNTATQPKQEEKKPFDKMKFF